MGKMFDKTKLLQDFGFIKSLLTGSADHQKPDQKIAVFNDITNDTFQAAKVTQQGVHCD